MEAIQQIKQLMYESCHKASSVKHFCQQVGLPYHTLRKQFRRAEGISLSAHWQKCRLKKAEELLSDPDKYVFEVAYEMGFTDEGNFTSWFKKRTGLTPTAYRQHFLQGS